MVQRCELIRIIGHGLTNQDLLDDPNMSRGVPDFAFNHDIAWLHVLDLKDLILESNLLFHEFHVTMSVGTGGRHVFPDVRVIELIVAPVPIEGVVQQFGDKVSADTVVFGKDVLVVITHFDNQVVVPAAAILIQGNHVVVGELTCCLVNEQVFHQFQSHVEMIGRSGLGSE